MSLVLPMIMLCLHKHSLGACAPATELMDPHASSASMSSWCCTACAPTPQPPRPPRAAHEAPPADRAAAVVLALVVGALLRALDKRRNEQAAAALARERRSRSISPRATW